MATGCQNKNKFIFCRKTYHFGLSIGLIINMLFRNNRTAGTDPYKAKQRGQTPTKRNSGDRPLSPKSKKNLVHPKHQVVKNIEIY